MPNRRIIINEGTLHRLPAEQADFLRTHFALVDGKMKFRENDPRVIEAVEKWGKIIPAKIRSNLSEDDTILAGLNAVSTNRWREALDAVIEVFGEDRIKEWAKTNRKGCPTCRAWSARIAQYFEELHDVGD